MDSLYAAIRKNNSSSSGDDDYETSYDPAESFSKKVVSDRELAKKKFLKISRKFSRMLKKLAK